MFVGFGGPGVHCQSQEMLRQEDEQSAFRVSGDMQEVLDALLRTMKKAGGKIKHGTAPRSGN